MPAVPICPTRIADYRYLTCTNIETGITATASGNQSNGYLLQAQANTLQTVASTGDSVLLPKGTLTPAGSSSPGALGQLIFITNNGANPAQIYGSYPDTINGVVTATGITLNSGAQMIAWVSSYSQSTNVATWASFVNSGAAPAQAVVTAKLAGADLNSTADQAITGLPANFAITGVYVTNCSGNATTAVGGIYTSTSKGGNQVVYSGQSYASLTSSTSLLTCSFATGALETTYASVLYFSLTTPQGSTMTADVYVTGVSLP